MKRLFVLFVLSMLLVASCAAAPASVMSTPTWTSTPAAVPTLAPTSTATSLPTISPTPDPFYAYSIDYLRSRAYGGGAIEFVEVLGQNIYFTRYLIRYPSDGLNIYGFADI